MDSAAEELIVKFNLGQEAEVAVILEVMEATMVVVEAHFQKLTFWNEFIFELDRHTYRGYQIRLYHLVIGWHTLECNTSDVQSYKSVAV